VKFLLVPLLIVGMFVSFTAALLAMLFFTETVKSPQELAEIVLGDYDSTRLSDDFVDPEDKLGHLTALVEEYRERYQARVDTVEAIGDSLRAVEASLVAREDAVEAESVRLGEVADATRSENLAARMDELATFYDKIKPGPAAEILQEGTLDDTTVATLMIRLAPTHMGKIMANMNADFAARITKIIQELQ
jgi:flagellar motility protein MotE (MotC chaperone)